MIASIIDHTLLKADASAIDVERLCAEADGWGCAAVCINPRWVRAAASHLHGSAVAVCTVVGFPLGANGASVKLFETERAIEAGAREIDMVIDIGALKSWDLTAVAQEIDAVVAACHGGSAESKIIIEAALLTEVETRRVCTLARDAGADFVKTSTGFGPHGATVSDVALMRAVVGPTMGIKASGGIRDLAAVRALVAAGATRIGTTATAAILREAV